MRTKKLPENPNFEDPTGAKLKLIQEIIQFLQLFIPALLAKRIISAILLLVGVPHARVAEWTGVCDKSVRAWNRLIADGETSKLLAIDKGSGRKSKFVDIEAQVLEEIEKGNYHTQQQIADMVKEKFNVQVSLMAVSRLLKKTALKN